MKSMK